MRRWDDRRLRQRLLRALLLQVLYTVRSERMLMEQLNYNLLFRWFVGLNMDDAVWDVTVFTKNRERLLKADVAQKFFQLVVAEARALDLMSDDHFTVDGTLLALRANIAETLLASLITEQGGKDIQHEEHEDILFGPGRRAQW
jgi:transposase